MCWEKPRFLKQCLSSLKSQYTKVFVLHRPQKVLVYVVRDHRVSIGAFISFVKVYFYFSLCTCMRLCGGMCTSVRLPWRSGETIGASGAGGGELHEWVLESGLWSSGRTLHTQQLAMSPAALLIPYCWYFLFACSCWMTKLDVGRNGKSVFTQPCPAWPWEQTGSQLEIRCFCLWHLVVGSLGIRVSKWIGSDTYDELLADLDLTSLVFLVFVTVNPSWLSL